jgi:hypothetical protein
MVRDVQRAIAAFAQSPQCGSALATALTKRFTAPPKTPLPGDVASDLAAAVRESAPDSIDTFRVGARGTFRGTALKRGEFEPLWAGVRPTDEGTPPAVVDGRVRSGGPPRRTSSSWERSTVRALAGMTRRSGNGRSATRPGWWISASPTRMRR